MHSPPCPTWDVHKARFYIEEAERRLSPEDYTDQLLHSWESELLMGDPEFFADLDRMIAETRAWMDREGVG